MKILRGKINLIYVVAIGRWKFRDGWKYSYGSIDVEVINVLNLSLLDVEIDSLDHLLILSYSFHIIPILFMPTIHQYPMFLIKYVSP